MGKLILVGAGPGDPELITLKAIKALKSADVVLYDALANVALLDYCKSDCIKVFVGKKSGIHAYQQIIINDMIVDYAKQYSTVIRLKGGDPYVFGRGHEELEHATEAGLEVEVVPGISSALAVPATAQIPLTKRGINESFWVVTGTTTSRCFSEDMELAARSSATIIILMGMKNLPGILNVFRAFRSSEEPVAIIQNGTLQDQRQVFGNLNTIESVVSDEEIINPAIIVIGAVVNERSIDEKTWLANVHAEVQTTKVAF